MLTPPERRELRDQIVREAIRQRKPNPLLTVADRESELNDLIPIVLDLHEKHADNWGNASRVFCYHMTIKERT